MSNLTRSERLDLGRHQVQPFVCGNEELDRWLKDHASHADSANTARTFVWATSTGEVVAYYSMAMHHLVKDDLPTKMGRGAPQVCPALIIGKLALHSRLHGRGLGSQLLVDALARVVQASEQVAAKFVVVDAIDHDAAAFYRSRGFVDLPNHSRTLVLKVSTAAATIAAALAQGQLDLT